MGRLSKKQTVAPPTLGLDLAPGSQAIEDQLAGADDSGADEIADAVSAVGTAASDAASGVVVGIDSVDLDAIDEVAGDDFEEPDEFGSLPPTLPLVPIRDNVYFPRMIFPLIIGRDRSIRSIDAAAESPRRLLVLASQRDLLIEEPDPEDIFTVGVVAEIMHFQRMPDNMVRVMLEAGPRVRITGFEQTDPYLRARIEIIPAALSPAASAPESTHAQEEALARTVTAQFERIVTEGKGIPAEALVNVLSVDEPDRLVDAIVPYLGLRVEQKQSLLETVDVADRLEKLATALHEESEILEIQKHIRSRVEQEVGQNQREFLLREQLKAIQLELGERDERLVEIDELREKIEASGMSEDALSRARREIDRLERMPAASPESSVSRTYVEWLIALPWTARTEDTIDLDSATKVLEDDHFGLEKVKDRILEFLAVRQLAGESHRAPILCFVGPPGVGKTSLGRSVARALGRKFARISLGGIRDDAEIRGHRRTYVGALPGRILQALRQCAVNNPVIVLDEIDKMGADLRSDPSSALLEALDPEQNAEFSDHYMETSFDLSRVLFIATANLLDTVQPALRDRLEVIPFTGYVEAEKVAIARQHLIPRQISRHGLADRHFALSDSALTTLVREYTREAGVRQLEREIGSLCRKSARRAAGGETLSELDTSAVADAIGKPRFRWDDPDLVDSVGAATGLVYTEAGGDTVTIEVQPAPVFGSEGKLILTGQLGEIMRESGQAAWTFVRSRLPVLGVSPQRLSGLDVHVHVPAGAVPKDGPSAGVTIAVALASALTARAVRHNIAMTGEITLRGRILPVGGVKEKLLAAHRAGLRTVLLPSDNARDLDDIPADVRAELTIKLISDADEALALALHPAPASDVPAAPESAAPESAEPALLF